MRGLVIYSSLILQVQQERDELYQKFMAAIQEVQQKTGFKNLLLERKLQALSAAVEKREVQFNEVLAASSLDPAALTLVSRKLEVGAGSASTSSRPSPCTVPPSMAQRPSISHGDLGPTGHVRYSLLSWCC